MNVFIVLSLILISALVLIVAFWLMWKKVNRIEDTSNDCIRILEHQEIQLISIVKSIEQLHIMAFGLSQKIEDNGVLSAELNEWLEYLKKTSTENIFTGTNVSNNSNENAATHQSESDKTTKSVNLFKDIPAHIITPAEYHLLDGKTIHEIVTTHPEWLHEKPIRKKILNNNQIRYYIHIGNLLINLSSNALKAFRDNDPVSILSLVFRAGVSNIGVPYMRLQRSAKYEPDEDANNEMNNNFETSI